MSRNTACIILAAGRGTRMKSDMPKMLHKICGRALIEHINDLIAPFFFKHVVLVVGYKGKEVADLAGGAKVVKQDRLLGSADAVKKAVTALRKFKGDILVLYGDVPLLRRSSLKGMMEMHRSRKASCTLMTARPENPAGYGRILRNAAGNVTAIAEETEVPLYDRVMNEVNAGPCCFKAGDLLKTLRKIKRNDRKKEYYLTDVVGLLEREGKAIASYRLEDPEEAVGVNSRADLARADAIMRRRTVDRLMECGVSVVDPASTHVDPGCSVGRDTVIHPYSRIHNGVKIGPACVIGPFSRLRPGTRLSQGVEIGNFVELTRAKVGPRTKIKHHSYIGDAVIGREVNIGAGTITANYDGKTKEKTVIKDRAFIGSGTIFVAPVTIGKGAVTGAGAVVTKRTKVPDGSVVVGVPARVTRKR